VAQLISEKDTGVIGELAFSAEAMRRGYKLAQPLGDNEQFDLLLTAGGDRLYRVQVKASANPQKEVYTYLIRRGKNKTEYFEVDVFALYLIPERIFFIIPRIEAGDRRTVKLRALPRKSQWAIYRENWGIFESDLNGFKNERQNERQNAKTDTRQKKEKAP
jgi:hypothetical protein